MDDARIDAPDEGERKIGRGQRIYEETYARLKEMILNEELPPGYQALEQEIADKLGISRTPVREALARLQDEGLVERIPRRGFRIVQFSAKDTRDLYDLLQCLEGKAVELLTLRRLDRNSPEIRALHDANATVHAALKARDLETWAEADRQFHRGIIEGSGNPRLAHMAYQVWEQVHRVDRATMRNKPIPYYSPLDHDAILEAIAQNEPFTARELMQEHRLRGMNILLEAMVRRNRAAG